MAKATFKIGDRVNWETEVRLPSHTKRCIGYGVIESFRMTTFGGKTRKRGAVISVSSNAVAYNKLVGRKKTVIAVDNLQKT